MKKSKIKLLTATACLALVGTASAAWVYAGTATASANIGVKVASYASAGTITVTGNDKIYILMDKDSVTYVKDSDYTKFSAKHNVPENVDTSGKSVSKKFKVTIQPGLADYISFKNSEIESIITNDDGSTIKSTNVEYDWEDDTDIFDSLPELAWVYDKCPTTDTKYIELINTIKSDTITDSNWDSLQNTEWNATELNSNWYVSVTFYAYVE